jgi:demethylmenaquinone methyltransferase/2-methoxy-6-polyprenyl-1,4-benzoquinol methylase
MRQFVFDKAKPELGDIVLDVATGSGYQAAAFAREGFKVIGVDYVFDRVVQAQSLHPEPALWGVGDIQRLPFKDKSFDIVTISLALHDMPPELRLDGMRELRRVARRRVVILEPRAPRFPILRQFYAAISELIDESLYIWDFSLHDFESLLKQAGFKILSADRCYHGVLVCYGLM